VTSASFERIDYQLRNNKHIERRLMFDRLARGSAVVDYSSYRYLGFGSMWFVDYRLAHRVLGIGDMVSMERSAHAERALFNRPFRCIDVKPGDSGATIEAFTAVEWQKPMICWLDYDGSLDADVAKDLSTLLAKAAVGSVIAVSVNANFLNYRPKNISGPRRRIDTALGQVENMLGASVVPARFDKVAPTTGSHEDIGAERFPEFLAVAILSWMVHHVTKAKRVGAAGPMEFVPIFNYCHKDGVDMVTVGGVLVDPGNRSLWKDQIGHDIEWSKHDSGLSVHERLDLIPITVKEKVVLDSCLPLDLSAFIADARRNGLRIADEHLNKYWRYYRQFPLFFETSA
jgi:hypothetical protein